MVDPQKFVTHKILCNQALVIIFHSFDLFKMLLKETHLSLDIVEPAFDLGDKRKRDAVEERVDDELKVGRGEVAIGAEEEGCWRLRMQSGHCIVHVHLQRNVCVRHET